MTIVAFRKWVGLEWMGYTWTQDFPIYSFDF